MSVHPRNNRRSGKERRSGKDRGSATDRTRFDDPRYQPPPERPHEVLPSKKAIYMSIGPKWEQIEGIRKKTRAFLRSHDFSSELVDALTMVSSELVENGMKYGSFDRPQNRITFKLHISGNNIIVEVTHPTSPSASHHLRQLDKTIQWIRGYQNPFQAYLEKLKEVAKKPIHDHESGLGLVRIAYEGKSILDFFVAEDNALNVSAIAGIEKRLWR